MSYTQLGDKFKTFKKTVVTEELMERVDNGSFKSTVTTTVTEVYTPINLELTSSVPITSGLFRIKSTGRVLIEPQRLIKLMRIAHPIIPKQKEPKDDSCIAICDSQPEVKINSSNVISFKTEHIA